MAARKRIVKKLPEFRLSPDEKQTDEDLKQVKKQTLKDLEENEKNKKDWYDKELEKNLKNIK